MSQFSPGCWREILQEKELIPHPSFPFPGAISSEEVHTFYVTHLSSLVKVVFWPLGIICDFFSNFFTYLLFFHKGINMWLIKFIEKHKLDINFVGKIWGNLLKQLCRTTSMLAERSAPQPCLSPKIHSVCETHDELTTLQWEFD